MIGFLEAAGTVAPWFRDHSASPSGGCHRREWIPEGASKSMVRFIRELLPEIFHEPETEEGEIKQLICCWRPQAHCSSRPGPARSNRFKAVVADPNNLNPMNPAWPTASHWRAASKEAFSRLI